MKQRGVSGRVVSFADLVSHKTNSGLQGCPSKSQSYVIMSCVAASFLKAECGNRAKTGWGIGSCWNG